MCWISDSGNVASWCSTGARASILTGFLAVGFGGVVAVPAPLPKTRALATGVLAAVVFSGCLASALPATGLLNIAVLTAGFRDAGVARTPLAGDEVLSGGRAAVTCFASALRATGFGAVVFLMVVFLIAAFATAALLAALFCGAGFFTAAFFTATLFAAGFRTATFFSAARFGAAFVATGFFVVVFFTATLPAAVFLAGDLAAADGLRGDAAFATTFAADFLTADFLLITFFTADFFVADLRVIAMRSFSCGG